MENTIEIRKKVKTRYLHIKIACLCIICFSATSWILLYQKLSIKTTCSLGNFLLILLVGEIVLGGFFARIQLFLSKKNILFMVIPICTVNAFSWLIYLIIYMFKGIKPSKISVIIIGILLSILVNVVILMIFCIFYNNIDNLVLLYNKSYKLEDCVYKYGTSVKEYNNKVDIYNNMNTDIKDIGKKICEKKSKQKYIDKIDDSINIPYLDISDIRIFYSNNIYSYLANVDKLCKDVDKEVKKILKQNEYIDFQVNKKQDMLREVKRTMNNVQNEDLPESLRKQFLNVVNPYYKKLAKQSKLEKKIKPIKRSKSI